MGVSRRTLILGGAGVAVVAGVGAAVVTDILPGGPPVRRMIGMTGPSGTVPAVPPSAKVVRTFLSQARRTQVTAITMAPEGFDSDKLPKCVALHGRGGDANWMVDLGVPEFLTAAAQAGVPPFAVISVDGGTDSYWTVREDGDDPQKMLTDELGPIQAAFGISMGGFGALRLARARRDLQAVAVISPALFKRWSDARTKNVFLNQKHWEDNEPLRHLDETAGVPLGVWCGTEDPLLYAAKALVEQTHPAQTSIASGAHDNAYWRRVLPDVLFFVGTRLSGPK
jgi:enterochelin esterase-like enzyme